MTPGQRLFMLVFGVLTLLTSILGTWVILHQ
jgi:hypothetical protein